MTSSAFTGGAFELVGLLSLVSREHLRQQQSEFPRRPLDETGKTAREEIPMGMSKQAGSAVLHKRIRAFGSMAIGFGLMGIDPVSAVALALGATVVLAIL